MVYQNYMEKVVIDNLNSVLEQFPSACHCERCREDIVAWVLNRLPPKYVVTELGLNYTKLNQIAVQAQADVTVLLTQAAQVVLANPRHT